MNQSFTASRFNDTDTGVDDGYRAYSTLAVLGFFCGLASPLAFSSPVLYIFPVLGILACGWALHRIRLAAPELLGKTVAQIGLLLAIVCGVGAVTRDVSSRYVLQRDAWQFGQTFFEYLRRGEPEKSYLLSLDQVFRPPLNDDEKMWREYELQSNHQQGLRAFLLSPEVRAVLELRDGALVRPYAMLKSVNSKTSDGRRSTVLNLLYAVTYQEQGRKKSFFVTLQVERSKGTTFRLPYEWRLASNQVGININ